MHFDYVGDGLWIVEVLSQEISYLQGFYKKWIITHFISKGIYCKVSNDVCFY